MYFLALFLGERADGGGCGTIGITMYLYLGLCYVMWNLFTVGSLQFPSDNTIASLKAKENPKKKFLTSSPFEALILFNEEHQGLLKQQVPLGWEWGRME